MRDDIEYDGSGDDNNRLNIDLKRDYGAVIGCGSESGFWFMYRGCILVSLSTYLPNAIEAVQSISMILARLYGNQPQRLTPATSSNTVHLCQLT